MNALHSPSYSFGVTGYPLGHSLSPRLHEAALRACGLQGQYRLYPVQPLPAGQDDLGELIGLIRKGRLDGLNVTIPHKQAVIPYLDELTPLALQIGAVNTIYRNGRSLVGDNTDAPGFMADLQNQFPRAGIPLSALVLGSGGSARAVTYALLAAGWQVIITARRPEKALEIKSSLASISQSCEVLELESLSIYLENCQEVLHPKAAPVEENKDRPLALIVNTTPVGMSPDIAHSPWPKDLLFPRHVFVYDLVYNPIETVLVRDARAAGMMAQNGLGMLVEQAALSFDRWTGIHPSTDSMYQAVLSAIDS